MLVPNVPAREVLLVQPLHYGGIEIAAATRPVIQKDLEREGSQLAAEPRVDRHREPVFGLPDDLLWNESLDRPFEDALRGPPADFVTPRDLEGEFDQAMVQQRETSLEATSH